MSSQFLFSRSFAHSIRLKIKHKLVDTASHLKQINRLFLPFSHIIVLTMRTSKKEKRDRKIEKTGLKDRVDIGELDASIHNSSSSGFKVLPRVVSRFEGFPFVLIVAAPAIFLSIPPPPLLEIWYIMS